MANPEDRPNSSIMKKILGNRRTWVALFVLIYALLLSSTWNLVRLIFSWCCSNTSSSSIWWLSLYASILFGVVFGLLFVAAVSAIVIPAMVVGWITILVLLALTGRSRRSLVLDGRKITADIGKVTVKSILKGI